MLGVLKMRAVQIRDLARSNGWRFVLKEMLFLHRSAIVVEKDLGEIPACDEVLARCGLKVIEVDENLLSNSSYKFSLESRRLKAERNLNRGYGGVVLVRGNLIVGDTWYWTSDTLDDSRLLHSDLQRFGFRSWSRDYVYTFDIFVVPGERKGGISAIFQNCAMQHLRLKGFTKAFGFYWADNIPAHWCTRITNKWRKLREVSVNRFVLFTWVSKVIQEREQGGPHALPELRRP